MNFDTIKKAVLEAGEVVRKTNPSEGIIAKEGRANFVTGADLASEKILKEAIQKNFSGHQILSEETVSNFKDVLAIEHLWVIDPIDGTNNFRHERDYSGISVGYVEKGKIEMGMIFNPFRNELFHALKGQGAFVNDKKIKVGNQKDLSSSVSATDNSYDPNGTKRNLEIITKLSVTPFMLMRGSAVLMFCDVAAGRVDLYMHNYLKPWDNAAGFLIAREAGAVVKNFKGEDVDFTSPQVLVGNYSLVDQFIKAIT